MKSKKMQDRRMYFALMGALVGIIALAALPKVMSLDVPEPLPTAPQIASEVPTLSRMALIIPEPPPPAERLLKSFTSLFKTKAQDERVHNTTLGAEKLNDSILEPNKEWSFNTTVGPRTEEAGFKNAPTLFMGEILPGLGGGICQVSSTVHAVAILAGLDVVKRQSHSRPSNYILQGYDATVNYPEHCWKGKQDPNTCFDLVLRNPYAFPLIFKTRVHEPSEKTEVPKRALTIELWGLGPVAKVETKWRLYSTAPFEKRIRRVWRKGEWKQKKQAGQQGVKGGLVLTITWPDDRKEYRVIPSHYKPVDEVWWVGKDWPKDQNPWD